MAEFLERGKFLTCPPVFKLREELLKNEGCVGFRENVLHIKGKVTLLKLFLSFLKSSLFN